MFLRFVLTSTLVLAPTAAMGAQLERGLPASDRETREVFSGYAQCVVKERARDAAVVVLSTIGNSEILRTYPHMVEPDCLRPGQQLALPGEYLRYGLADALVRTEFAQGLPPDIAQAGPLTHMQVNETDYQPKPGKPAKPKELQRLEDAKNKAIAFRLLSIYGECVDRRDPAAALRLVLTKPRSNDEAQSFAAMKPALEECLPEGQTVTFTLVSLRGTIAMNLYRLAKAPRVPATAASK
jgi:hypothetical protein